MVEGAEGSIEASRGLASEPSSELPQGVVTFLLTDIEGSTELWELHRAVMGAALARHEALIEAAVTAHGGRLIKSQGEGDSTLSVFPRASNAVNAALGLQPDRVRPHEVVVGLPDAVVVVVGGGHQVALNARVEFEVSGPQTVHADHVREILNGGIAQPHLGQQADHDHHAEQHQREGDEPPVEPGDLPDQRQADDAGRH
jgi:class 3 adenylate cyclase